MAHQTTPRITSAMIIPISVPINPLITSPPKPLWQVHSTLDRRSRRNNEYRRRHIVHEVTSRIQHIRHPSFDHQPKRLRRSSRPSTHYPNLSASLNVYTRL